MNASLAEPRHWCASKSTLVSRPLQVHFGISVAFQCNIKQSTWVRHGMVNEGKNLVTFASKRVHVSPWIAKYFIVIWTEEVWIRSCQLWVQRRHGLPEHLKWSWICIWPCSNHPAFPERCLPALLVGNHIVCTHGIVFTANKNQKAVKPIYWTKSVYMRWQCILNGLDVFYILLGSNQLSLDSISKLRCAVHGYGSTGWAEFKATASIPVWWFKMRNTSNHVWSHLPVF